MEIHYAKIRQLEEVICMLKEEKKNEEQAKHKALQEVQVKHRVLHVESDVSSI